MSDLIGEIKEMKLQAKSNPNYALKGIFLTQSIKQLIKLKAIRFNRTETAIINALLLHIVRFNDSWDYSSAHLPKVTEKKTVRNVYLSKDIYTQIKELAVKRNMTLTDFIVSAIQSTVNCNDDKALDNLIYNDFSSGIQ